MIRTLIFDFGDVFINLDIEGAIQNALNVFNMPQFDADMLRTNKNYEMGLLSTIEFLTFYQNKFPELTQQDIIGAWNFMIKDFPEYRLDFLKELSRQKKFDLILLSNTNALHIEYVKKTTEFYNSFKEQFDQFYLSHEIHLRKPESEIFTFVLRQNNFVANECLFIDDTKENINTAFDLGFHTWHIDPRSDDVINLFESCNALF